MAYLPSITYENALQLHVQVQPQDHSRGKRNRALKLSPFPLRKVIRGIGGGSKQRFFLLDG